MRTNSRSEVGANAGTRRFYINFHGDALEYFKIWAVNNLRVILTLGLYYPWAKVRNKRYIIANFSLGGSTGNFDYLAPGWSVFIGTAIVLCFFLISNVVGISVIATALYIGIFFILTPWFLVRSMAFGVRYTCFRGLRFSFTREYLPVYLAIFALLFPFVLANIVLLFHYDSYGRIEEMGSDPIFLLSSLWVILVLPGAMWVLHKYKVEHTSLGLISFSFETKLRVYYGILIRCTLLLLVLSFVIPVFGIMAFGYILYYFTIPIVYLICYFLYRALLTQRFWSGVRLKGGRGRIRMKYPISEYMFVQFIMFFATILSLGLLRPWAKVYQCNYLARHTLLESGPGLLDGLMEGDKEAISAVGAEYIDQIAPDFDLDFGWG